MNADQYNWAETGGTYQGLIEPHDVPLDAFPESTITCQGIQVLLADLSERSCLTHVGVQYAHKSGMALHLHIIEPRQPEGEENVFPLIMFVQGSAWFEQKTGQSLVQLGRFARRGYVIAVVQYRPSPLAPFPAQVKDTKTAIRWMRDHAAEFHADPDAIYLWGDSSGGHTVVMTGLTLNDAGLDDEDPRQDPIVIKGVIDYYGPTNIATMNEEPSIQDHVAPNSPEGMLIGGSNVLERPDLVAPTITTAYLSPDVAIAPCLIMHGSKDRRVPYGQSVLLYQAMVQAAKDVVCYQLKGADHGGAPFWTEAILDIVEAFIEHCAQG